MLKGRGRDPRGATSAAPPAHFNIRLPALNQPRTPLPQRQAMKPEPDYEVVEFPSDQYVNAKLQPPPPPPPRPPTGHPAQAGASCGLCGGGGARVRCAECGRRALCASCDDMYHRHPKRRHHQRQALSPSQLSEDRPPLPPKTLAPVPPPRRHKMTASPKPPMQDQRHATMGHVSLAGVRQQPSPVFNQPQQLPIHIQNKMPPIPGHIGSMPFLNTMTHQPAPVQPQIQSNTLGHLNSTWSRPRGSLQGFNMPQMGSGNDPWESPMGMGGQQAGWGRGMRRGASVLELGGAACGACAHCAPAAVAAPWRYGSCASLDHPWAAAWTPPPPQHACCAHQHAPQTPQPYRRADSRTMSRVASRAGSRAASPAQSVRSRTSRRKHRTPSPPPLPSSDADSESESEEEMPPARRTPRSAPAPPASTTATSTVANSSSAATASAAVMGAPWQCEHCTFENEAGVRVCAICCRTASARQLDLSAALARTHLAADSAHDATRLDATEKPKRTETQKSNRERTSTGCGPSPDREQKMPENSSQRLVTPTRELNGTWSEPTRNRAEISPLRESNKTVRVSPYRETKETPITTPQRHSVSVGPSPPRHSVSVGPSPPRQNVSAVPSPQRHSVSVGPSPPRHSVSVGPSPPRETSRHSISVGPSPPRDLRSPRETPTSAANFQKKSAGTSPPRDVRAGSRSPAPITKTKVSNTGTSPPPQNISTQTYSELGAWERGSRRRARGEARRERSRSRHSLSSDTRESERSVRTVGAGFEWRESSPPSVEWGGRLARRASHLDLRRAKPARRASFYGSEATSPERASARAASVEALAGDGRRRAIELARLLADAERLGYDAAEVQVALSARPEAPLEWLRSRWAGLVGAVRGAAARLAPHHTLSERDARAALARHRGAVWPAVTECVDALRGQAEASRVSSAARVRGRVWGSPAGADDEAAPRAEYSSDEYDPPPIPYIEDEWGQPLDEYEVERAERRALQDSSPLPRELRSLIARAELSPADETALLQGLLSPERAGRPVSFDFIQSENDFIDAYNALTRASPLPNIVDPPDDRNVRDHDYLQKDDEMRSGKVNEILDETQNRNESHNKRTNQSIENSLKATSPKINLNSKHEPKKTKIKIIKPKNQITSSSLLTQSENRTTSPKSADTTGNQKKNSPGEPLNSQQIRQSEEKSNNLNDIVDNTQKLIQQMKDEINSDIHSLDDGHAQTSLSEHDTSSNDERGESSYSETEEETDNLTSDEKEMSSESEEEKVEIIPKIDATFPNRTSSEDNEQFEEALDNLDDQIEEVKHANIEILDSIARSLQEEHTLSIELSNHIEEAFHEKEVNMINENLSQSQDTNNNLFVAVNTFDEIYAELNTSFNKIKENNQREPQPHKVTKITKSPPLEPITLLSKHIISELTLKMVTPTKLLISENKDPIFNGIIETIEIIDESEANIEKQAEPESELVEITQVETSNDEQINNGRSNSESSSLSNDSEPSQHDEIMPRSTESKPVMTNIEVTIEDSEWVSAENENYVSGTTQKEHNVKRNSVEKIPETPKIESTNKIVTVKSNIPKPIKTSQNIKAKVEKLAPKLIVSKVPVRRASIKQYPAPAPPKTHFGNIQSGHVKQLQSKIFDTTKPAKPQMPVTVDVKPSTSTATLSKKKPAPPPPSKQPETKQPTPPKGKQNYFRETCRTEDEWTDSDTEDESQIVKPTEKREEEPISRPSPPPPPTVRRVSGQIIDLANVQMPEGSPERQARLLLAGGALETWSQARLAVELVSRGAAPPAALLAALDCADLAAATAYLHQDCDLCAAHSLPEHEMVTMLRCTHRCCRECARLYFTVQVTERSVSDCVCPFCKLPDLETLPEDEWLEYFAHLDIQLKALLEPDIHELFQRKLRDRTLARDPNFRWCVECSSGFFVHPKQKKLRCPECRSVSCASCRKPWSANHEGLSCEQYAAWLEDNDPERAAAAVSQHLREHGLECPRCRFKYSLSRGGCMHFTCTQCKFEFCYGCGKPFMMGARCGLSEYCAKLGLHAHHPRNCLFYLRDKEPHELQTLLQMNNVPFETQAPEGSTGRCPVQLQRETPAGLVDGICGSEVQPNHAGLCKAHYVEALARAARALDPLPIMTLADLVAELRRRALPLPDRGPWDTDPLYAAMCAEIVKEKIPLD